MPGFRLWLARARGSSVQFDLGAYAAPLDEINRLEDEVAALSNAELTRRAGDAPRTVVYALAREAARRTLGLRPFDEQLVAALALDDGLVVEMQTGEGKTLAAVMPAALNARAGKGVHVLTFNDYLARRDAEWMRPVYESLGLSVAFVQHGMTPDERRQAYRADVTYLTAKEAGFDHLRDLLAMDAADVVHRPFHFALVDEADSILIDEARSPLVIAGSVGRAESSSRRLADLVAMLEPGVHFDQDEYGRDVELTEAGFERAEQLLGCGSLHIDRNYTLLTELNCALHAQVLLRRDVDYIVRDGRIQMVDEFTGRVVTDRHWPDGLQAAVEAKERIDRQPDGRILGSITLQHFLRGYPRLCGMTGTAQSAAEELAEQYRLGVVVIPTHRPMIRDDRPDVVFTHREAKETALVEEIGRIHATGRPVLVGTLTVEESERLAGRMRAAGVACEVLNAKHDEHEAHVIARAGALGAVTISTNMAGRGTDIRLGGEREEDRDRVAALGGLFVIGTNRHESRRVDLQLRGRAGRQGDPGESRFFLSLEDDLLVKYGIANLIPARFIPARSDTPIENPVVSREIARAQRIIEGQNFEIRKTLSRYTSLVENQRRGVMARRDAVLHDTAMPAAERALTLFHIDRAWRDHLALCADVREGIHLISLGGVDPLTRFSNVVAEAFAGLDEDIEASVREALDRYEETGEPIDIKGPSSTWTYLVNDDPFRNQLAMRLMGPGKSTLAMGAALVAPPLFLLWALVERFWRRERKPKN